MVLLFFDYFPANTRICEPATFSLYFWTEYVFFMSKRVNFIPGSQTKIDKYKSNK